MSDFPDLGVFFQGTLTIFVVPATNLREIEIFRTNSARSATFRKRVGPQLAYVSRSASRHSPIVIVFCYTIGKVGREMWPGKPSKKSPRAGVAMRGSVSVRGFDSSPFRLLSGPVGSARGHFSIFLGTPIISLLSLLYPYSPGVAVLYISV